MLARMKKPITEKYSEICILVPSKDAQEIQNHVMECLRSAGHDNISVSGKELYSVDEVFPDSHPGRILKGLRTREDLTQVQLAEKAGLKPHHVSEMENGKRVIGKAMARRLAKVLNSSYQMLL